MSRTAPGADCAGPNGPCRPEDRVLAIIPARGGSKGIARKNVRLLGGKPLVAHSIEAALGAVSIDRVVVSTEDPEIAAIAAGYGPDLALARPPELAQDDSSLADVTRHALETLADQGYRADNIVILLPTHPFRTPALLDFLTGKLLQGCTPVVTMRPVPCSPWRHFVAQGGLLESIAPRADRHVLLRSYGLFTGYNDTLPTRYYCHLVTTAAGLTDIDYEDDFIRAERLIAENRHHDPVEAS